MGATLSFASPGKEEVEESLATEALLKADYKEENLEEYVMSIEDLNLQEKSALLGVLNKHTGAMQGR